MALLADVGGGYLPPLVQVCGPPGTGKTSVVRPVATEATAQFADLEAVYVNLKECRSPFAAANQILFQVVGPGPGESFEAGAGSSCHFPMMSSW